MEVENPHFSHMVVFCTPHFVFCTKSAHFSHVVLRPAPHFESAAVLEIALFDDKLNEDSEQIAQDLVDEVLVT